MSTKGHATGMLGVYLTAAELTRRGLVVSTTSRSAIGADLLATDECCRKAWSIQVKTNAKPTSFWLLNKRYAETASDSHVYVFVNLKGEERPDFYIVPSKQVAKQGVIGPARTGSVWYSFSRNSASAYERRWSVFGLEDDNIPD